MQRSLRQFLVYLSLATSYWLLATPVSGYLSLRQSSWSGGYGQQVWSDPTKFNEYYHVKYGQELTIPGNDTWYDSAWKYRRQITVNNKENGEVTHFPILIKLEHKVNIEYKHLQADTGNDLRFTDSDGKTLIPYDIERWDQAGTSYIWVKVPKIDASSDKDYIYMYYGNPAAKEARDPGGVFDNKYTGVYHFQETPTHGQRYSDSTHNSLNGTWNDLDNTRESISEGIVDRGSRFRRDTTRVDDYVEITDNDLFTPNSSSGFSLSFWVRNDTSFTLSHYPYFVSKYDNADSSLREWVCWGAAADNNYRCLLNNGSNVQIDSNVTPTMNTWEHIFFSWDGTTAVMYVNGNEANRGAVTGSITNRALNVYFGRGNNNDSGNRFRGDLDEIRIANTYRDPAWVKAEYTNIKESWLTYGHEELFGSELLSSIFDASHGNNWGYLSYTADEPEKTAAKVKVRTGNNMYLADAPDFETCESIVNKSDISSNKCVVDGHRYIQYQVILETTEAGKTPIFKEISITDFLAHPVVKGISTVASPSPLPSVIYDLESPQAGPRPSPSLDPNHYPLTPIFDFLNALIH